MARIIDLPEIENDSRKAQEPRAFNMPRESKHSPAATGCAVVLVAWGCVMALLLLMALTGGLARLAFWAVGA